MLCTHVQGPNAHYKGFPPSNNMLFFIGSYQKETHAHSYDNNQSIYILYYNFYIMFTYNVFIRCLAFYHDSLCDLYYILYWCIQTVTLNGCTEHRSWYQLASEVGLYKTTKMTKKGRNFNNQNLYINIYYLLSRSKLQSSSHIFACIALIQWYSTVMWFTSLCSAVYKF